MVYGLGNSSFKAYNLIELMVALAIIAIISAVAIPSFAAYTARAKVADGISALDSYKQIAMDLLARYGTIAPYYVLFTDDNTTGLISGTPTGTSAAKSVSLKYIAEITAYSGTSGGDSYILIGAGLQDDKYITSGADHVYIAGLITSTGALTWKCGASTSQGDTVSTQYLPQNCQDTLP